MSVNNIVKPLTDTESNEEFQLLWISKDPPAKSASGDPLAFLRQQPVYSEHQKNIAQLEITSPVITAAKLLIGGDVRTLGENIKRLEKALEQYDKNIEKLFNSKNSTCNQPG